MNDKTTKEIKRYRAVERTDNELYNRIIFNLNHTISIELRDSIVYRINDCAVSVRNNPNNPLEIYGEERYIPDTVSYIEKITNIKLEEIKLKCN